MNTSLVFATPGVTTYQAKIVKPNGLPLEANNVNFKFTILNPAGNCILYTETYSSVNMASTGGLISFSLGSGVKTYPVSATTFAEVFSNITPSLSCDAGGPGSYSPNANDTRKIVMQFHDGTGWQTLPAMNINAVPYAMYASEAQKLSGLPSCGPGQALGYNGVSFSCEAVGGGGVTSSTVIAALGYEPVQPASLTNLTSVGSNNTLPSISSNSYALGANNTQNTGGGGSNNSILLGFNNNIDNGGGGSNSGYVIGYNNKVYSNGSGSNEAFIFGSNNTVNYSGFVIGRGISDPANNAIVIGNGYQTLNVMSNNRVGLGTSSPVTALDVSGGVRLGLESATCDSTLAGTLRYNGGNVEYCNGTSWSGFSGAITSASVVSALGYTPANSATVSSLNSSLSAVSSSVNTTNLNITSVSSTVSSLSSNLNAVSSTVGTLSSDVFSVSATVTSLSNTVSTLSTTVSNIGTSVTALSTSVASLSASMAALTASQWVSSGTAISFSTGNVGVGTSNPTSRLTVSGSAYLSGPVIVGNTPPAAGVWDMGPLLGSMTYSAPFYQQDTMTDFSQQITTAQGTSVKFNASNNNGSISSGKFSYVENVPGNFSNYQGIYGDYVVTENNASGSIGELGSISALVLQNGPSPVTSLYGVYSRAYTYTGTVQNSYGGFFSSNSQGGSITNNYGVMIDVGGGAVTNNYGLYITDSSSVIASQTYNIYSAGVTARNYFAGYLDVGDGSANSAHKLHVHNQSAQVTAMLSTDQNTNAILNFASDLDGTPRYGGVGYDYDDNVVKLINDSAFNTSTKGLAINTSGSVGIGTVTPTAKLHLAAGTSSLAAFKLTSSTLLTTPASGAIEYDGTNLYYTDGTNTRKTLATGVGVTSASVISALGYTPASDTSGTLSVTKFPDIGATVVSGAQYTKVTVDGKGRVVSGSQLASSDVTTALGYTPANASSATQWTTSGTAISYSTGGVGIGISTPESTLNVVGAIQVGLQSGLNSTLGVNSVAFQRTAASGTYSYIDQKGIGGALVFRTSQATTQDTNVMTLTSSGHVGVGTLAPTHTLTVSNTALFNPSANVSSAIMVGPPAGHAFGGGVLMKDYTNYAGMWTNGSGALLVFGAGGTASGFSSVNTLVVTSAATVGIGTVAPTEKLEVAGNLKVTGEIYGQKSWGFKKGPTAFATDYVNTWASGGGSGSSIDCTSSANGCTILKSGTYEIRCVQRANSTTSTFVGIALNGDRTALETRADAVWDHDHALGVGQFTESNFTGTLTAGNFITCGPAAANQTYMIYAANSYNGTLIIKRID